MANPFVKVGGMFGRFFGSTIADAAGYGIGGALTAPLEPGLQELTNQTWTAFTATGISRPPTVYTVVEGVAKGHIDDATGRRWAHEQGFVDDVFDALVLASKSGPEFGNLLAGYRRGLIGDTEFDLGLERHGIEEKWWPMLRALERQLLSPAELANARQQQFIDRAYQQEWAQKQGLTEADADVQFELAGLPPGIETGLEMLRRGIINPTEFAEIVATGHTKTKWTQQLLEMENRVLSAQEYAELRLRGWITTPEMNAGGALTGHTPEQMNLMYENRGRPATSHQMAVGLKRGGSIGGPTAGIPADFQTALERSSNRPEYTQILWLAAFLYPPLFQTSRLVNSGDIDAATAITWLEKQNYAPDVIDAFRKAWGATTTAAPDPHVKTAQGQLFTTTHTSYKAGEANAAAAQEAMTMLNIPTDAQGEILALWNEERKLVRKQLTPAQIKKAVGQTKMTQDDAVARLVSMGFSVADAQLYLGE